MGLIKTVSSVIGKNPNEKRAGAYLSEIDERSSAAERGAIKFQYFPETVNDSRSVDLQAKYGIGSSHPIYQWVHGSAREIAFETNFTAEDNEPEINNTLAVASGFIKNPISSAVSLVAARGVNSQESVDIESAIAWLRSKTYPIYTNRSVGAPPKLVLWLEGSGITSFVNSSLQLDVVPVIMTTCDVTYESFFRNGKPRSVSVSLRFVEIIQVGQNWKYVGREKLNSAWTNSYQNGKLDGYSSRQPKGLETSSVDNKLDVSNIIKGSVKNRIA